MLLLSQALTILLSLRDPWSAMVDYIYHVRTFVLCRDHYSKHRHPIGAGWAGWLSATFGNPRISTKIASYRSTQYTRIDGYFAISNIQSYRPLDAHCLDGALIKNLLMLHGIKGWQAILQLVTFRVSQWTSQQ